MPKHNVLVVLIASVPVLAAGQQFLPAPSGPTVDPNTRFEVASIRQAVDTAAPMRIWMTPERFEYQGLPIIVLIRQALQKPDYQIVGAPGWTNTDRYTIMAKAPDGTPPGALTTLMVNLLKDRFQLATHIETRELPIYNLVLARADGRLGPDLKATPADCQTTIAERSAAAKAGGPPPPLPSFPGPNEPLPCGFGRLITGNVAMSGRTIAQMVPTLADFVGRPVIDKTGLTGLWDYALKFAPEGRNAGPLGQLPGAPPPPPADPDAPSLFTAVQEQLGLKLENARGPVEVLVIDKIERPLLD